MDEFKKTLTDFKEILETVKGTCEKLVQSKLTQLKIVEKQVEDLTNIAKRMEEDKKITALKKMEDLKKQVLNDNETVNQITSFLKSNKEYY